MAETNRTKYTDQAVKYPAGLGGDARDEISLTSVKSFEDGEFPPHFYLGENLEYARVSPDQPSLAIDWLVSRGVERPQAEQAVFGVLRNRSQILEAISLKGIDHTGNAYLGEEFLDYVRLQVRF